MSDDSVIASSLGFDGVDSLSPRREIEAEIERVEALRPQGDRAKGFVAGRLVELRRCLETATEEGSFRPL